MGHEPFVANIQYLNFRTRATLVPFTGYMVLFLFPCGMTDVASHRNANYIQNMLVKAGFSWTIWSGREFIWVNLDCCISHRKVTTNLFLNLVKGYQKSFSTFHMILVTTLGRNPFWQVSKLRCVKGRGKSSKWHKVCVTGLEWRKEEGTQIVKQLLETRQESDYSNRGLLWQSAGP